MVISPKFPFLSIYKMGMLYSEKLKPNFPSISDFWGLSEEMMPKWHTDEGQGPVLLYYNNREIYAQYLR